MIQQNRNLSYHVHIWMYNRYELVFTALEADDNDGESIFHF